MQDKLTPAERALVNELLDKRAELALLSRDDLLTRATNAEVALDRTGKTIGLFLSATAALRIAQRVGDHAQAARLAVEVDHMIALSPIGDATN